MEDPIILLLKYYKDDKVENIDFKGPETLIFSLKQNYQVKPLLNKKLKSLIPLWTWEDTLGNLKTLDQWRHAVGYSLDQD